MVVIILSSLFTFAQICLRSSHHHKYVPAWTYLHPLAESTRSLLTIYLYISIYVYTRTEKTHTRIKFSVFSITSTVPSSILYVGACIWSGQYVLVYCCHKYPSLDVWEDLKFWFERISCLLWAICVQVKVCKQIDEDEGEYYIRYEKDFWKLACWNK